MLPICGTRVSSEIGRRVTAREGAKSSLSRMHPWPFDTITPERWATLQDEDKAMIEALTATFIAAVARQRQVDTRAPASDDRPYPARR